MVIENRRGWIRLLEVFIALIIITGFTLIVIDKGYVEKGDVASEVYETEVSILREIQMNDALRDEILGKELPTDWDSLSNVPDYLECKARLCEVGGVCEINIFPPGRDIYVESVTIMANLEKFSPRVLKIFCWVK